MAVRATPTNRTAPFPAQAIIFDLDGTLTPVASPWRLVHEAFGLWERAVAYHDQFFRGEIDYETWCRRDVALWQGRSLAEVRAVLARIQPCPEAIDILKRAAAHRRADGRPAPLMILSSGFDELAGRVLAAAGLSRERVRVVANSLREENGVVCGAPHVVLGDPVRDKRSHLVRFLADHGVAPHDAIALDDREEGDLYADLGAFIHVRTPADLRRIEDFLV
ncbi:MAG: hypothetical protein C4523_18890 [Myxococcales bacterium]|nr:MAG: hypothetical protein C4523_18890 [Myxococcales bacterium]